jgi:hypothetical protein
MTNHTNIEQFKIQNEQEIDEYLEDLFSKDKYRNMSSVEERIGIVDGDALRSYFVAKAKEFLSK